MNSLRKFHADLQACELEDRLLPVMNNLGVIVLTAGPHLLLILNPDTANTVGAPNVAAIPSSLSMTSLDGLFNTPSGKHPRSGRDGIGRIEREPGCGVRQSAQSPVILPPQDIPLVTRNTIANDALNPLPRIGRLSGDQSPILPRGQFYRGGVPVIAPDPPSPETPAETPIRFPSWIPVTRVHSTDLCLRS